MEDRELSQRKECAKNSAEIQSHYTKFYDIEGYKYTIEVRFKATEALEMIGMKMPE